MIADFGLRIRHARSIYLPNRETGRARTAHARTIGCGLDAAIAGQTESEEAVERQIARIAELERVKGQLVLGKGKSSVLVGLGKMEIQFGGIHRASVLNVCAI